MKIGIVDLDTSHPESWIPILKELGHEIVGVYDHGGVHPSGYAADFVQKHDAGRLFPSLDAMVGDVDLAMIQGCDWDQHVSRARPFVEAGRAVLIDKPLAGRLADLQQIHDWIRGGHRISGGSGLLYCQEAAAIRAQPPEQPWRTAFVGCGVDPYNYGIHAYSLLVALFGTGISHVRHLGGDPEHSVAVHWDDGRHGIVHLTNQGWIPFHATLVNQANVQHVQIDHTQLYRSQLAAILPYLTGATDAPPVPASTWLLPEQIALCARHSQQLQGAPIPLHALDAATAYDGQAYQRYYQSAKYPNQPPETAQSTSPTTLSATNKGERADTQRTQGLAMNGISSRKGY